MVRFKVVKGSHILLAAAVLVLAAVVTFILLQDMPDKAARPVSGTEIVQETEAKAVSAFASAAFIPLEIEILPDVHAEANASGKCILIYHTHTHEAYRQVSDDPYEAEEAWRTADEAHSVVRLGALLAEELRILGYNVVHDTTDHELDSVSDSYVRALETLEGHEEPYDLYIDLHRDAYTDGLKSCIQDAGGNDCAQLMMLVGRGDNYSEKEKPDYDGNLAFAQRLTRCLNEFVPDICRNVTVKQGRYNQHFGRSILVEVGHNQNTLQQAQSSIPYLAKGIDAVMRKMDS